MRHHRGWGFRGALLAAAAGTVACSTSAAAQAAGESPGAALRRQLVELAANPSNVVELIETGRAAMGVGDGEAALGFFTRAAQLAPRDYRVKAGLAAAHARTGRPETALVLFSEAASLGAPDGELAGERGLTYDLLGQTARAQQDYMASLRYREDAEVRRRLALSLAISGQKDAALRLLDPQLRQADRAALRARVMVLALTGDVPGATAAARASMPMGAAQAITPFLPRLASLTPAQMASAANLGRVPGGQRIANAGTGAAAAYPGAVAFAGGAPSLAHRLPVAPTPTASRRRPGANEAAGTGTVRTRTAAPNRVEAGRWMTASSTSTRPPAPVAAAPSPAASAPPAATAVASAALFLPHPHEPLPAEFRRGGASSAAATPAALPVEIAAAAVPAVPTPAPAAQIEPVVTSTSTASPAAPAPAVQDAAPAVSETPAPPAVTPQPLAAPAPSQTTADGSAANLAVWSLPAGTAPAPEARSTPRFADVAATVAALPVEVETTAPAPAAAPSTASAPAPAAAKPEPKRDTAPAPSATPRSRAGQQTAALRTPAPGRTTEARTTAARPAHPARVWVQLAYSPNRNAFGYEMKRFRTAAPELLRGRNAHVATTGDRHRLLLGPFETDAAARTFINDLKKKEVDALAWTSPAGTEVARFAGK